MGVISWFINQLMVEIYMVYGRYNVYNELVFMGRINRHFSWWVHQFPLIYSHSITVKSSILGGPPSMKNVKIRKPGMDR